MLLAYPFLALLPQKSCLTALKKITDQDAYMAALHTFIYTDKYIFSNSCDFCLAIKNCNDFSDTTKSVIDAIIDKAASNNLLYDPNNITFDVIREIIRHE